MPKTLNKAKMTKTLLAHGIVKKEPTDFGIKSRGFYIVSSREPRAYLNHFGEAQFGVNQSNGVQAFWKSKKAADQALEKFKNENA